MYHNKVELNKLHKYNLDIASSTRYINPMDINLPPGYSIEVFAQGLHMPNSICFTSMGDILVTNTGQINGNPVITRLYENNFEIIADNFDVPLNGVVEYRGDLYVSHRGKITVIKRDGTRQDIIEGLPSFGDYSNSRIAIGNDGKMYFGQGTATNSGVVGPDNLWINTYPYFYDTPGSYLILNGQNFESNNVFSSAEGDVVYTGAYSPYGVPNLPFEVKKGSTKATGSILRADLDGSNIEIVAWGLRHPSFIKFDIMERLFTTNNGFDIRGSRPIANAPDEFHIITPDLWYGWPDYSGGEPVTLSRFKPEGGKQPEFLLLHHPNLPPKPLSTFLPSSTILGFDFNYNEAFGPYGDIYIAEYGSSRHGVFERVEPQILGVGHRISRIDNNTGGITTFAINKSGYPSYITGEGGLGRPSDVAFGPDGAMYVVDMGMNTLYDPYLFRPNTGVIWRISRTS